MNINESTNEATEEPNERIARLRESIRHAFPATEYTGKVTPRDGAWPDEHDDEAILYQVLHGRIWTDVPEQLLYAQPDGYALLTDEAFVAFLPAWLLCSLENIDSENEIRNFVVYAFCPKPEMVPDMTWFKVGRLRALNPQQRLAVRALLAEFAERERSSYLRKRASAAVALIDTLG